MGHYDFHCRECDTDFDEITPFDETGVYPGIQCPKCGSDNKEKVFSAEGVTFTFSGAAAQGTKWYNASHDRRFYHKLEQDRKAREEAEKKSHMGAAPYNPIDDISSGKYFGEVK